ncbi:MAG: lysylphosphatidylglycerol synthase domain-containing protein [Proteobacteria bacterium]|nr:lysylphosphatidylglycerol synthase domain-containing protein [Pseudomonadota bacterium]
MTHEADLSSPEAGPSVSAAERRKKWLRLGGTIASIVLFTFALVVLYNVVNELDANEVKAAFARATWGQIGAALGFTALSYLMLTGYDVVALKAVTIQPVPYRIAALASFTSYAVSFTLGFPLLTAATVRYWIYSSIGLSAKVIASLTLIAGITFWLGMGVVLGTVMLAAPQSSATFTRLPQGMNMLIGAGVLGGVGAYLFMVNKGRRRLRVQGWSMRLPGVNVTLKQLALGAMDVIAGAAVLYVLLPQGSNVAFPAMLAAYVFACLLGIASHAPGGIGVFEATMLLALPGVPREPLLGALLVYRLCYYLIPFLIALALLGVRELSLRARRMQRTLNEVEREEKP